MLQAFSCKIEIQYVLHIKNEIYSPVRTEAFNCTNWPSENNSAICPNQIKMSPLSNIKITCYFENRLFLKYFTFSISRLASSLTSLINAPWDLSFKEHCLHNRQRMHTEGIESLKTTIFLQLVHCCILDTVRNIRNNSIHELSITVNLPSTMTNLMLTIAASVPYKNDFRLLGGIEDQLLRGWTYRP